MSGVFLTIFALIWSGMVLSFDGFMGHGFYKQLESAHYPSATATIFGGGQETFLGKAQVRPGSLLPGRPYRRTVPLLLAQKENVVRSG